MKIYSVINEGTETRRIVAVPQEEDEYNVHRYNRTTKERIHDAREKANVRVEKLEEVEGLE